jgi:phage FluMu protein Com
MTTPTLIRQICELETAYYDSNIPCGDCNKPAAMIGTGHHDRPCPAFDPPPYFKCAKCHTNWRARIENEIAGGYGIMCAHCNREFDTINNFSLWRPV